MDGWPTGIRPDGAGLRIRIWRKGRLIHSETIKGDPTSKSLLTAAKKRRDHLISRITLGLPLSQDDDPRGELFETVAQDYLDTLGVKRSTSLEYEITLNRHWLPAYAGWPVNEITTQDIKQRLSKIPVALKTRKNILIPLRGVLQHAGLVPNPADGVRIKKGQTPPVERYTPAERDALLRNLGGQSLPYFALLFGCGLRPGEALALEWTDYDGEELMVSKQIVRRRLEMTTKTSVYRRVYVPTWARPILNQHTTRFEGGWIFQTGKGEFHKDSDVFNQAWRRAHKKARVPFRRPYTCRHTRAAELLSTGVNPADAAKQLGHSLEVFLRTYTEWIEEYTRLQDKSRFEGFTAEKPPRLRSPLKDVQ